MPNRLSRKGLLLAAGASALGLLVSGGASAGQPDRVSNKAHYEIGLFGDMPYGPLGRAQFPAVLADMNASRIAFSLFDGDIKNGSEPCLAEFDGSAQKADPPDIYLYERDLLNTLRKPVVMTPGDNEWTDCDRPATKGPTFDANGRLAYDRKVFFSTPKTLGASTFDVHRQSAEFPENARFIYGKVTYVTVNVTGSDNNFAVDPKDGDIAQAQAEYAARNAANLAWLKESFAAARKAKSKGIMIVQQADMFSSTTSDTVTHFADMKALLARESAAFSGQVVLVNGDSHYYINDKPLTDDAGNVIQNFQRVMTYGSGQNHWVSASIDPNDPGVFSFHQHVIAANVPAYTFD